MTNAQIVDIVRTSFAMRRVLEDEPRNANPWSQPLLATADVCASVLPNSSRVVDRGPPVSRPMDRPRTATVAQMRLVRLTDNCSPHHSTHTYVVTQARLWTTYTELSYLVRRRASCSAVEVPRPGSAPAPVAGLSVMQDAVHARCGVLMPVCAARLTHCLRV